MYCITIDWQKHWSNRAGARPGFLTLSHRPQNSMATDTQKEKDKAPGAFVGESVNRRL